jgi:hypothetical protein
VYRDRQQGDVISILNNKGEYRDKQQGDVISLLTNIKEGTETDSKVIS